MESNTEAIARLAICTVAVVAVSAVLYVLPLRDRPLTAALTFIFVVLIVAAVWGFRHSVFVALLEGLAFARTRVANSVARYKEISF